MVFIATPWLFGRIFGCLIRLAEWPYHPLCIVTLTLCAGLSFWSVLRLGYLRTLCLALILLSGAVNQFQRDRLYTDFPKDLPGKAALVRGEIQAVQQREEGIRLTLIVNALNSQRVQPFVSFVYLDDQNELSRSDAVFGVLRFSLAKHGCFSYLPTCLNARLETKKKLFPLHTALDTTKKAPPSRLERIHLAMTEHDKTGLARALIFGDKFSLDPDTLDRTMALGIGHNFVVSGLHFAVVFQLGRLCSLFTSRLIPVLPLFLMPKTLSNTIGAVFAGLYALVADDTPATSRAVAYIAVFCLSLLLGRRTTIVTTLCSAALLHLALWDVPLTDVSLVLSYCSFAAILLAVRVGKDFLTQVDKKPSSLLRKYVLTPLLNNVLFSGILFIAIAPLSLFYFSQLNLWSALNNALITPLFSMLYIPVHILALGLGYISLDMLSHALPVIERANVVLLWLIDKLPLATYASAWSITNVLGAFLCCGAIFLRAKLRKSLFLIASLAAFTAIFAGELQTCFDGKAPHAIISLLNVGNGDAIIIDARQTSGSVTLIDGGGRRLGPDPGRRIVAPSLRRRGITHLDAVIASHGDLDHYGGLHYIIRHFSVSNVYVGETHTEDSGFRTFLGELRTRRIPISRISSRNARNLPKNIREHVSFISPPEISDPTWSDNERAIAGIWRFGSSRVLLLADLERNGLHQAQGSFPLEIVDVIQLPHHGSKYSRAEALLAKGLHRFAVLSSKRCELLYPVEVPVFSTGCGSDIEIDLYDDGLSISGGVVPTSPSDE